MEQKFVTRISDKEVDGLLRVSLNQDWFSKILATRPYNRVVPYETTGDANGNGVRVYKIEGTEVFGTWMPDASKPRGGYNVFAMKAEDARARFESLQQSRANQVKLPFDMRKLALETTDIVAAV